MVGLKYDKQDEQGKAALNERNLNLLWWKANDGNQRI
jgi:hypothetical protein